MAQYEDFVRHVLANGTPKGDRLESEMASVGAAVHYFPYTAHTSTTALRQVLATR